MLLLKMAKHDQSKTFLTLEKGFHASVFDCSKSAQHLYCVTLTGGQQSHTMVTQ